MMPVPSRPGLFRIAFVAVALLSLSACAGNGLLDQLDQATPVGSDFSKELFKNYAYLARSFGDQADQASTAFDADNSLSLSGGNGDVADLATAYAQKALDAAQGQEVLPEPPPDGDADAATMRDRLLKALEDGRGKFPADAARAQAEYDCWVMDRSVAGLQQASAQCRRGLDAALSQLEHELNPTPPAPPAPPPATDYQVYFDLNSWDLKAEQLTTLQQAIATARAGGQSRITIVGHTDTSGSAAYNQRLSVKRANVVEEALVDMGARREAISTSGVGENDLAVQTGDGVKEPKNRRAVVTLVP
ncbi:MAG TPA: OmpA family protein [Rhizomicrobium sp.]|nr:OmpA family protein [Rhizomicrobium sp.]